MRRSAASALVMLAMPWLVTGCGSSEDGPVQVDRQTFDSGSPQKVRETVRSAQQRPTTTAMSERTFAQVRTTFQALASIRP